MSHITSPQLPHAIILHLHTPNMKVEKHTQRIVRSKENPVMTVSSMKQAERKLKHMLHEMLIQTSNGEKCHA